MEIRNIIHKIVLDFIFKREMNLWGTFEELAESVLDRIEEEHFTNDNDDELREALYYAMNDELIYTEDQWKMMEIYCTPQDANFDDAWNCFENDLMSICEMIRDALK